MGAVRTLLLMGLTAFWLVMMSQLIHREFFALAVPKAAYEIFPINSLDFKEEYRAIYLGDARVGFSHISLEKQAEQEKAGAGPVRVIYEMRHHSYLSFLFLGTKRELLIKGKARLDPSLYLRDFEVRISSGDYWTDLAGEIGAGHMDLLIKGEKQNPVRRVIPVAGPVLYSESMSLIWGTRNLSAGRGGRFQVFNPLLMNTEEINFRVANKESIPYKGKPTEVYDIEMQRAGIKTHAWVTPEGWMLREEGPTGLVTQKEEGYEIFDAMRSQKSKRVDLPNLYSIPAGKKIPYPEKLNRLKIRVTTPGGEKTIEIVRSVLRGLESISRPVSSATQDLTLYLSPAPQIQSDDPVIAAKAAEIAAGGKSALAVCRKIIQWVHANVSPVPTIGLPSARQVLDYKKGDCNEYTVLFTALARSLGIPTQTVSGLVYREGRFFYHAWAEVFLGSWIPIDPTFAQFPADVTHIPLVAGDLGKQVALIGDIGRIKVEILETDDGSSSTGS